MRRIYVAIDPAISNTEQSDEHGIIVVGQSADGRDGYVLEDASLKGSPLDWAKRALSVHDRWQADGIAVEVNQGGDMVAQTIRSVRAGVKIVEVRATRGKHVRAEPIAALYEQGRIHHVGAFIDLETQMTQMTTFGFEGDGSPDRVDALVWGLSVLFPSMVREDKSRIKAVPPVTAMPMARR
jgi:phage terminase large subunit-like protein